MWNEARFTWEAGALVEKWRFASDWKPTPDDQGGLSGWEPVFHPAIAGDYVVVPGMGGGVFVAASRGRRPRHPGPRLSRPNDGSLGPSIHVAGPAHRGPRRLGLLRCRRARSVPSLEHRRTRRVAREDRARRRSRGRALRRSRPPLRPGGLYQPLHAGRSCRGRRRPTPSLPDAVRLASPRRERGPGRRARRRPSTR